MRFCLGSVVRNPFLRSEIIGQDARSQFQARFVCESPLKSVERSQGWRSDRATRMSPHHIQQDEIKVAKRDFGGDAAKVGGALEVGRSAVSLSWIGLRSW